jgi:ribosomal protein S18 acetylase RimI-like enzyme
MKIRRVTRFSNRVFKPIPGLLSQLDPDYGSPPAREEFEEILRNRSAHFLVAELDNKAIAGILTLVQYRIPTGIKFLIEDVVVDESHRGKGIGRALILYATGIARSMGAGSVDLTSRPFRIAANQLYLKMGFVRRETNVYRLYMK